MKLSSNVFVGTDSYIFTSNVSPIDKRQLVFVPHKYMTFLENMKENIEKEDKSYMKFWVKGQYYKMLKNTHIQQKDVANKHDFDIICTFLNNQKV